MYSGQVNPFLCFRPNAKLATSLNKCSPNLSWNTSDAKFIAHHVDRNHIVLNGGYAFNRSVWNFVKSKRYEFVHKFNKNWDCAMADLMDAYPEMGRLQITSLLSRIRNIGVENGVHDDQVRACSVQPVACSVQPVACSVQPVAGSHAPGLYFIRHICNELPRR
jgi:hypothetical protein